LSKFGSVGLLLVALLLTSCGSDSGGVAPLDPPDPREPIELTAVPAPIELGSIDADFYEGIPYGPFDENLLDLYLPASDTPTPLFIHIHGGGFIGGSRNTERLGGFILALLQANVAFASIDYRLLGSPDADIAIKPLTDSSLGSPETEGVIKPLGDSARALQFLRYHAEQLNIDEDRVIASGISAGAGTALWIAFSDDMADPDSEDPVLRESTRVTAAIAVETQATYDVGKWTTVVFEEYGFDLLELADSLGLSQRLLDFYGITDIADFDSPDILEYRARVDMLELMDIDDPPFLVDNYVYEDVPPLSVPVAFHHANHALVLHQRAEEIGLENVAHIPQLGIVDPSRENHIQFALRQFDR
jgi:hypothetical protein